MKQGLKEEKAKLRAELLEKRAAIPAEQRIKAENVILKRFVSLASFRFAKDVLLYYPIKGEVDVIPIFNAAIAAGKRVAFPLCNTESSTMTYHYVSSLDELKSGAYGIREPRNESELYVPSKEKNDIVIVPAVCFDKDGYRIGYGKGYYDRYLNDFGGTTIGVAMSDFIMPSLPRGRYDKSVDLILTEKGAFSTK